MARHVLFRDLALNRKPLQHISQELLSVVCHARPVCFTTENGHVTMFLIIFMIFP